MLSLALPRPKMARFSQVLEKELMDEGEGGAFEWCPLFNFKVLKVREKTYHWNQKVYINLNKEIRRKKVLEMLEKRQSYREGRFIYIYVSER